MFGVLRASARGQQGLCMYVTPTGAGAAGCQAAPLQQQQINMAWVLTGTEGRRQLDSEGLHVTVLQK